MKKFVVISHTHWDREWYMPFQQFRLRLVDLIDRLIDIVQKDESYIFHLDAQTIVLEDYLELRPDNKQLLKELISAGNLRVGPWYLQNDFYLTAGEATIRNLQIGTAIAEEFGKCSKVGYAPDQFGNVSQLPQILKGFGIDSFVFGRGYTQFETVDGVRRPKALPTEFIWQGTDGTEAIAIHLKHWYNNAQRIPGELELAQLLLDINEQCFEGLNASPYVLLMNGVDHLEAQDDVNEIIAALNEKGYDIAQKSLDEYIECVQNAVAGKQLYKHVGALNYGEDYSLLKGCWSSRIYLKKANVEAEGLIINKLQPLYAYLENSGFKGVYPVHELNYLWKSLLKNHPHDSICGCSVDAVHSHMEDRYNSIQELGQPLLERGMKLLALHSPHPMADDKNYSVTVFNCTEKTQTAVVEATLNFTEAVEDFAIYDAEGKPVEYEVADKFNRPYDVFSPLNLPGILDVNTYVIRFIVKNLPSYSSTVYAVVLGEKGAQICNKCPESLENGKYRISVEGGELVIEDKQTGEKYLSPIMIEDCIDRGDAYVYRKAPEAGAVIKPAKLSVVGGALKQTMKLDFEYQTACGYDFERLCPMAETVTEKISCTLSVSECSDTIVLEYSIDNKAKDHRIRLLIDSGLEGGVIATDSAFDYNAHRPLESCDITDSDTHNNATFADVYVGNRALSLYTEGQHEVALEGRYLAITVLRCTGVINRAPDTLKVVGGQTWLAAENQCIRTVCGRVGFVYGQKKSAQQLYIEAKLFRNGLLSHGDCFDFRKYSGGRFAVQSSRLEKLYYVPDKYLGCAAKNGCAMISPCENLSITCVKGGICGDYVVRFVNLSNEAVEESVKLNGKIYLTDLLEGKGTLLGENEVVLKAGPKQIITLRVENEQA